VHPITHLLVSWTTGEQARLRRRDMQIVALAGIAPDIDGLSLLPDLLNKALGRPETGYYFQYHHVLAHGLPAAILAAVIAFLAAEQKWKTALFALIAFHLHLLCDLVGSRGPTRADIWDLPYLAPFSTSKMDFVWSGQWQLNAWPNITLTILLLALVFYRAWKRGYSPVCIFSLRADRAFVQALRRRFSLKSSAGCPGAIGK
jgi:inner membrane protein